MRQMSEVQTYEIILADPPWRYNFCRSPTRRIENQYPTLTVSQIELLGKSIPAAADSVLFLWATAPKLLESLAVMEAWGFRYRTHAVWDKKIMGMGYWFRGQHELLLVGTKGKYSPPRPSDRISSVISHRRGRHSRKPTDVQVWIEKAFPHARKLELFARNRREGWAIWGDEVRSSIDLKFGPCQPRLAAPSG